LRVQCKVRAGAAGIQRAAGWAVAGFGAAAALEGFGRIGLRAFGGGAAGCNSANTGPRSMMVVGG
jgi:hypothetical protein